MRKFVSIVSEAQMKLSKPRWAVMKESFSSIKEIIQTAAVCLPRLKRPSTVEYPAPLNGKDPCRSPEFTYRSGSGHCYRGFRFGLTLLMLTKLHPFHARAVTTLLESNRLTKLTRGMACLVRFFSRVKINEVGAVDSTYIRAKGPMKYPRACAAAESF